ncbi:hypothetical protein DUNSADRAFT_6501 [Dunaliella salina]|uniref:Uncharacterized protein n=1 Tax=Dunaliella salina TaxID=3046 RepID=A0ABQ7GN94_DUNSA|nr:hypothetical protein DUNSADRAFT_6501 [Dunaliella salina]|eukprot:KAF5836081.1 hypothetical protein DUNSADRAFT_6501 [Dunaliella salina]
MQLLRLNTACTCGSIHSHLRRRPLRPTAIRCQPPSAPDDPQDSSSFAMGMAGKKPQRKEVLQEGNSDSSQVVNSLQVLSSATGRSKGSNNTTILASDDSEETWRKLDKKVNKYPTEREFTAIGTGESFKDSMVKAVEEVVGSVHLENVAERRSKNGNYCSIKIMAYLENGEQVLQIYHSMKRDTRMRWFI